MPPHKERERPSIKHCLMDELGIPRTESRKWDVRQDWIDAFKRAVRTMKYEDFDRGDVTQLLPEEMTMESTSELRSRIEEMELELARAKKKLASFSALRDYENLRSTLLHYANMPANDSSFAGDIAHVLRSPSMGGYPLTLACRTADKLAYALKEAIK